LTSIGLAALAASVTCAPALAQSAAAPAVAASEAPRGVSFVAASPAMFDATVSAERRAALNGPPMPPQQRAPKAYEEWKKAAAISASHPGSIMLNSAAPTLTQTNLSNGPMQRAANRFNAPIGAKNVAASSYNWSGTSIVGISNAANREAVLGEFVVPQAQQAFGTCDGGWDYSSQWVGVDGNGSNDVLQLGAEADAYCSGGAKATYYSAWIEWYPYSETRVSTPAVKPGDVMFVEVWNTTTTTAFAWLVNLSTQQSAVYTLTAYPGYPVVGNSVEWIVERPGVSGGLATLTNYVDVAWPYGFAWNYTSGAPTAYYPGIAPSGATFETITMLDNNSNPISVGQIENAAFLWFVNSGSSCGVSTSPC
jgi:hypothetical protein